MTRRFASRLGEANLARNGFSYPRENSRLLPHRLNTCDCNINAAAHLSSDNDARELITTLDENRIDQGARRNGCHATNPFSARLTDLGRGTIVGRDTARQPGEDPRHSALQDGREGAQESVSDCAEGYDIRHAREAPVAWWGHPRGASCDVSGGADTEPTRGRPRLGTEAYRLAPVADGHDHTVDSGSAQPRGGGLFSG